MKWLDIIADALDKGLSRDEYANKWRLLKQQIRQHLDHKNCMPENIMRPFLRIAPRTTDTIYYRGIIRMKCRTMDEKDVVYIWRTFHGVVGDWFPRPRLAAQPRRRAFTNDLMPPLVERKGNKHRCEFTAQVLRKQDAC